MLVVILALAFLMNANYSYATYTDGDTDFEPMPEVINGVRYLGNIDTSKDLGGLRYTNWYYEPGWQHIVVDGKKYPTIFQSYIYEGKMQRMMERYGSLLTEFLRLNDPENTDKTLNDALKVATEFFDPYYYYTYTMDFPQYEWYYLDVFNNLGKLVTYRDLSKTEFEKFKNIIMDYFDNNKQRNFMIDEMNDVPRNEFLKYFDNNFEMLGYAYNVFVNKIPFEEAKEKYNPEELPVVFYGNQFLANYKEFANFPFNGTFIFDNRHLVSLSFKNMAEFREALKERSLIFNSKATWRIQIEMYPDNKEYSINFLNGIADKNNMKYQPVKKALVTEPIVVNNRTFIPVRGIFEELGAYVDWIQETKQVRITKGELEIMLTLDSDIALVNGKEVQLPTAVFTKDSRTMIPLRFVSEALGYIVDWDSQTGKITIKGY